MHEARRDDHGRVEKILTCRGDVNREIFCEASEHLEETRSSLIVALRRPEEPTAEERRRHEMDHLPFAGWCRACVAVRGKADQHFGKDHDEDAVARVSCDYCFMG